MPGLSPGPPNTAQPRPSSAVPQAALAAPWPRFWARTLDLLPWVFLGDWVVGALTSGATSSPDQELLLMLVTSVIVLALALLLDAICYAGVGNTIGKWLLGIDVRDQQGRTLDFGAYLRRNFGIFLYGFAAGLQPLTLVSLLRSFTKARAGQTLAWEAQSGAWSWQRRSRS